MNLTFLIPLSASVVLFILSVLILRGLINTRLITLIYLEVIPLAFGIWMLNRAIAAVSPYYVDLFRISNLCYIIAPMFLTIFVDLISEGNFTWKSIVFSFCSGMLALGAIFLDRYTVDYNPNSGWIQVSWEQPLFYVFLYLYVIIIAVFIFERHLIVAYLKNKGENKQYLKKINIIFLISVLGIIIFNGMRSLRMIDYPYINSFDALFFALGFGYLSWEYLKYSYLFHLDLIDVQLFGLFVFDNHGPLLYSYEFQPKGMSEDKELVASAMAGVDSLFKEILASDQPLREVRQESNLILLEKGTGITIGLVTNHSTIVTKNWLYQFRVAFEKEFNESLKKYFSFKIIDFEREPDSIVERIFYSK